MTSRWGSCKQRLALLTAFRQSVVQDILSSQKESIILAILHLLRHLTPFLIGQPPDLQIFGWIIFVWVPLPRLSTNTAQPFCIPTSMSSNSANRPRFVNATLGANDRLSCAPHFTQVKACSPSGLQFFLSSSTFEAVVQNLTELHFVAPVLLPLQSLISCLAIFSHLVLRQEIASVLRRSCGSYGPLPLESRQSLPLPRRPRSYSRTRPLASPSRFDLVVDDGLSLAFPCTCWTPRSEWHVRDVVFFYLCW